MWTELFEMFKKPAPKTIAQRELEESQRKALLHKSSANYHAKIAEYYEDNIGRLNSYLKKA